MDQEKADFRSNFLIIFLGNFDRKSRAQDQISKNGTDFGSENFTLKSKIQGARHEK